MTKELNFKNLTIKYDGDKFSKSVMRKVKTIENIGMFIVILAVFGVAGLNIVLWDLDSHFGLSVLIGFVTICATMLGGVFGLTEICKRFSPRHYEFVTWLMKCKSNEIEIGWLNGRYGRYVVNMYGQHGWMKKELGDFIYEDYKLEDKSDKSKPVHMTIDLMNGDVEVVVENQ